MSRSRKRLPAGTCCVCKSQKRGKQFASRKFRRRARVKIAQGRYDGLPLKSIEITSPWDLGGDGKLFYGFGFGEPWYEKEMRK